MRVGGPVPGELKRRLVGALGVGSREAAGESGMLRRSRRHGPAAAERLSSKKGEAAGKIGGGADFAPGHAKVVTTGSQVRWAREISPTLCADIRRVRAQVPPEPSWAGAPQLTAGPPWVTPRSRRGGIPHPPRRCW